MAEGSETAGQKPVSGGGAPAKAANAGSERFAFLWKALGFVFVAILVSAAVLFVWRRELLTRELQEHYSRSAARQAREIELAYANHEQVFASLVRVAEVTGQATATELRRVAAEARLQALTNAQEETARLAKANAERQTKARERLDRLAKEFESAKATTVDANEAVSEAVEKFNEAQKGLDDAHSAYEAELAVKKEADEKALKLSDAANKAAEAAARAARHAETAVEAGPEQCAEHVMLAEQAAEQARQAADIARQGTLDPKSKQTDPVGTQPDAAKGAAKDPQCAEAAKKLVEEANASAEEAKKRALDAAERAGAAQQALQEAEAALRAAKETAERASLEGTKAFSKHGLATQRMRELEAQLKAVRREETKVASTRKQHDERQRAIAIDHRFAAEKRDEAAADWQRLRASILPSFGPVVSACVAQSPERLSDAQLCAARAVAHSQARGSTNALEVIACPGSGRPPSEVTLAHDARALIFAPPSDGAALSACARLPLAELLGFAARSSSRTHGGSARPFDEVLLLRPNGDVLFGPDDGSSLRLQKLPGIEEKSPVRASRMLREVSLGAQAYRAFLQPVSVRIADACSGGDCAKAPQNAEDRVVLCGLVSEERLFSEGLEVSPGFFLWAMVLLCFGVLALPLAKLWLVGPMARFRRFDVALLATSGLFATVLTVILVLATTTYFGLLERLDGQLAHVARQASERMNRALKSTEAKLQKYVDATQALQKEMHEARKPGSSSQAFRAACEADLEKQVRCRADVLQPSQQDGPRGWAVCEQVECRFSGEEERRSGEPRIVGFVSDVDGNQWVRSDTGKHAPNPVNIADRAYFQRALRKEGCLDVSARAAGDRANERPSCVTVEVVRSNALGSAVLVAAAPVEHGSETTAVVGISRRIPAFEEAALPLGIQIAIIDREGRVMVHSDRDTRQGQNLLDDFDETRELLAAMAVGTSPPETLRYRGSATRVLLERIDSADWYVVALAPRSLVDVVTADIVGLSLLGLGALLTLCLLIACPVVFGVWCLRRRSPRSPPAVEALSLRPNGKQRLAYAYGGITMLSAGIGLGIGSLNFGPPTVPMLAVGLSAATLGALLVPGIGLFGRFASGGTRAGRWLLAKGLQQISLKDSYGLCCFGFAFAVVVLPTMVIFDAARDHMMDTLVRAEQNAYLPAVRDNGCLNEGSEDPACERVFTSGTVTAKTSEPTPRTASCWLWPAPCVADLLPVFASSDRPASGREYRDERWKRGAGVVVRAGIESKVPSLPALNAPYFWTGMAVLGVLGLGSFLLIRASAERLFMVNVLQKLERARRSDLDLLFPKGVARDEHGGEREAEVGTPQDPSRDAVSPPTGDEDATAKAGNEPTPPIRCLLLGASPELRTQLRAARPAARFIELDAFVSDPARIERLERDIEGASSQDIVLLAAREPMRQLAGSEHSARWATLLERFLAVRAPPYTVEAMRLDPRELSQAQLASMWAGCTSEEKRILAQLAVEGYVNPHPRNGVAAMELAGRGLLDPATLNIPNRRLRDFIADAVSTKQFAEWETEEGESAYRALRMPLVLGIVLILGVVLIINPTLAALGPLVPVLAGSLPKVLQTVATLLIGDAGD